MSDFDVNPAGNSMELTPGQIASAHEHWVSQGYDPTAFDQAIGGTATPADPAVSAPDLRQEIEVLGADKLPALSPEQAAEMAKGLRDAGVSEQAINAALEADGLQIATDTRTEEQVEHDRAFPGASPSDFHINYHECLPEVKDLTALVAINRDFTAWASELGLTAEIGTVVIERALQQGQAYSRMNDAQKQLYQLEQKHEFERLAGGPEKMAEKIALASKAMERGSPAMIQRLYESGALHDAAIVIHLAHHAERLAARGA